MLQPVENKMATDVDETAVEIVDLLRLLLYKLTMLYFFLLPMFFALLWMVVILGGLCVFLFLIMCRVVRRHGRRQLPHLRQPDQHGRIPCVVGFFHPYCNAGGGGERVLWTAIRALQNRYPNIRCVIYTGDTNATPQDILTTAQQRFNIQLPRSDRNNLEFVFLNRRNFVEASRYPHFTLLGQSLGSMVLGYEAMMKFTPDVFIDTMGYAFTLPMFRYIGGCKVGCYVHYPTISTDMLARVSQQVVAHNNAGAIARSPALSKLKLCYYHLFAWLYGVVGKTSHAIMVNSSWTRGHIDSLWQATERTNTVYPPCDTQEFLALPLQSHDKTHVFVSIAQFRPEKDHPLQLRSFHKFLESIPVAERDRYTLQLVGSCRNEDDQARVDNLKNLAQDLDIAERVQFKLNVPFAELKQCLNDATIGLHTMWNEHFGIGVVECMAAGTIILAHKSGGPLMDIVINFNDKPTGYLADSVDSYAEAMKDIVSLSSQQRREIQDNARESVERFSEANFEHGFLESVRPILNVE